MKMVLAVFKQPPTFSQCPAMAVKEPAQVRGESTTQREGRSFAKWMEEGKIEQHVTFFCHLPIEEVQSGFVYGLLGLGI